MTMLGGGKKVMTKKAMKKTAKKKVVKKAITTFYGLLHKQEMGLGLDKEGDRCGDLILQSCKSDHMNHCINSFAKNNNEEELKDYMVVKVEILGKPMVKTTREVTIKK